VEVRARGLDRLPRDRTCVFVSNHQSIYDIPIIFWWLPVQLRIIAKDSLGSFPFLGWHLRRSGHVLVNRRSPGAAVVRRLKELIQRRQSVIVFPEGTRSRDGALLPFKRGVFLMAIEAGVPVVPVSVAGSRHVMRKGRLMTCPGFVELMIHDPIETSALAADAATELAERVRAIISAPVEQELRRPFGEAVVPVVA
jgi:1-acyl-sn-glycerol-3-phosphate acyltransferase